MTKGPFCPAPSAAPPSPDNVDEPCICLKPLVTTNVRSVAKHARIAREVERRRSHPREKRTRVAARAFLLQRKVAVRGVRKLRVVVADKTTVHAVDDVRCRSRPGVNGREVVGRAAIFKVGFQAAAVNTQLRKAIGRSLWVESTTFLNVMFAKVFV